MQFKQTLVRLIFLLIPFTALAQTTYIPQDARENILLERLEIKRPLRPMVDGKPYPLPYQLQNKPYSRRSVTEYVQMLNSANAVALDTNTRSALLSRVDQYNMHSLLQNNLEWVSGPRDPYLSKKPFLKNFYITRSNLYEVNTKDFFLAVNPVFQYYVGKEKDNGQHIFLNTRGATLRGLIANKIGFAAYITDNQERDPLYVQQWSAAHKAVPGQGFYKDFKTSGYDYFDARGYISFSAAKLVDIQFGYDKNFIGNGYRSLFLSDFSSPYLFLKLNTRVWKFNYQNLFMELNSAQRLNADQLFPKKYAAMHHLSLAVTKWLDVGLFEAVVFGRENHFEFGYLNPVIFYRSIEQQNGSYDNALAGLDLKANVKKQFQFYGQFLLDEFNFTEVRKASGWWANKYGIQLGAKYIDAFQIKNLDLQIESNRVRPFTYSHRDSVANYTHYNQPLAHPLGANFQEWIGIARYQPTGRLFLQGKIFYYMQGKDTGSVSFGSNIFLPNIPPYRTKEFGYDLGAGIRSKTAMISGLVSYEWKPNFFLELNTVYRKESATTISPSKNTFIIYTGIRWNMHLRDFEF
jgi:hypothetical protein